MDVICCYIGLKALSAREGKTKLRNAAAYQSGQIQKTLTPPMGT